MPAQSSVFKGLIEHADFAKKYVHARAAQADVLFDEMLHVADTPVVGLKTITKASGVETVEGGTMSTGAFEIDARKRIIARMAPNKYGDKQALEHSGHRRRPDGSRRCDLHRRRPREGAGGFHGEDGEAGKVLDRNDPLIKDVPVPPEVPNS